MYLEYWGLKKFPFDNITDPYFFYLSESHEEALSRLLYASKMRKGGAMLVGDIGCGKTLLSNIYLEKMREERSEVSLLTNPPLGSVEFLQEVLYQLGAEDLPDSKVKLLKILNEKLIHNMKDNKETIVIIDEAQLLNEETFEEARLLLNFQSKDRFLLTLVLIGQTDLKVKIKQIKQFDQRIAIRYRIRPFDFLDTDKYIKYRVQKAGFVKNVFTQNATKMIYECSEGIPRRINTICDLSLLIAFNKNRKLVDLDIITSIKDELDEMEQE